MSNAASLFGQLITFLGVHQASQWSKAAALTFLTADIIGNIQDEFRHVWRSKFSIVKFAYIFVRYYAIIYLGWELWASSTHHSNELYVWSLVYSSNPVLTPIPQSCVKYFYYYSYGGDILYTTFVNVISVVRIYALYGRSKKILAFFLALCMVEFATEFYVTHYTLIYTANPKNVFTPPFIEMLGCYTQAPPSANPTLIAWVPCIVVSFLFFAFTIYKLGDSVRTVEGKWVISALRQSGGGISPLLMIFVRDGSIYFLLIFAMISVQTYVVLTNSGLYHSPVHPWLITVFSCSCSRLVLNLHNYGNSGRPTLVETVAGSSVAYPMAFRTRGKSLHADTTQGTATTLFSNGGVTSDATRSIGSYPEQKGGYV